MISRRTAVVAAVAAISLMTGCSVGSRQAESSDPSAAADWKPVFKDGKLQPLPDGFPNKPITILNGDEAGSSDGIYARTMQKALANISPVNVEVLDKPSGSGGNWASLKYMQSRPDAKDGYMVQVMAYTGAGLDFIADTVATGYGYKTDDMNPVIATERVPFVVVTRGNAPWNTYQDLVDAAKASPGKLKYIAVSTGSQLDIGMMSLMAKGGWTAQKIPLKDNVQVATTIAAGQGDFSMELPDVIAGQFQAGKIKVPLVVGERKPAVFPQAQTTKELGLDEPWGSLRGLMATPETSDLHRQWLFELFKAAQSSAAYAQRLQTVPGATGVVYDHDEVMKNVHDAQDIATPILKQLNLYKGN
ncbi:MAG TPA: tripartite tricarboxylate transporter substrate-binding protein [Actinoplanes sp.]